MNSVQLLFVVFLLTVNISNNIAGEVITSFVDENDGHYVIRVDMRVNAELEDVYRHLVDLKNIHKLNDTIVSSIVKYSKGKKHEVEVNTSGCVLFFCTEQVQYQRVTELDNGYIMIHLDPAKSDFLSGQILWQVFDENKKTRVIFAADFEPDFWVPPLIGPWILTDVFLKESQETINELEKLAQVSGRARLIKQGKIKILR
ncbi:hypothetical protein MNBD_GAMMA22-2090 [hydrothermal vent metagenome]|uniref:Ribosome association toxin RatA n=1 Tax=hydrothermal vent metagenome TaxID=652676 RepID=A0A3B1B5Y6_9ZZZZ